ncbi:hypothetical protein [Carboxylicivirga taeanensis]|uniref:hypothetical protein n=1 Tax=Carboxylicivirga taeanensis TaxID=1416875 RepID=UPI003F6E0F44
MRIIIIFVYMLISLGACHYSNDDLSLLTKSSKIEDHMEACQIIGETKNIKYLPFLFDNLNDPRVSHHIHYKGMSVYQCKIIALKKISGLKPPNAITYKPDSCNIQFYIDWRESYR